MTRARVLTGSCPEHYAVELEYERIVVGERDNAPVVRMRAWFYPTRNGARVLYNKRGGPGNERKGLVRFPSYVEAIAFVEGLYWSD